jgi:hypothetical protein
MRKIERISVSAADRERLERLVRDRNTAQKVVWRARIVLLASEGLTAEGIAAAAGKSLLTVRRRRRRFVAKGVDGLLKDATRPSRVKPLALEKIAQLERWPSIVQLALRSCSWEFLTCLREWHMLVRHTCNDSRLARRCYRRHEPSRHANGSAYG